MIWNVWIGLVALILNHVVAAASSVYMDPETGLTFSSESVVFKLNTKPMDIRIAVPSTAGTNSDYDIVVQIVAPNEVGWAGLAFGANMKQNPLLLVWRNANNNDVVVSGRWASSYSPPQPYTGLSYTILNSRTNNTHFQVTLKCSGCTSWQPSATQNRKFLNPTSDNRIAWAFSPRKPNNPNSNTTALTMNDVHESHATPTFQFSKGLNTNFADVVERARR